MTMTCVKCGEALIAPDCSEFVSERLSRRAVDQVRACRQSQDGQASKFTVPTILRNLGAVLRGALSTREALAMDFNFFDGRG